MAAESPMEPGDELALAALKRADALQVLRGDPMDRGDLMAALGVSRTTIHRTIRTLEDEGLVRQDGNAFRLTALGRTVAAEVATYRRSLRAACRLQPLLDAVGAAPDLDLEPLADARVTVAKATNPYRPVERFVELLRDSGSLRGFDTTSIAPMFVAEIRDEILDGMDVDVVYLPAVVDDILDAYPEDVRSAAASGHLTLSTHDALPFGLAIFDDCVGVGGYDPDTGMLRAFADTADPAAREWAVACYERYRDEATVVTDDLR